MSGKIVPKGCPVCKNTTNHITRITGEYEQVTEWYHCPCGITFQGEYPEAVDETDYSEAETKLIHAAHTYAPLIEDLTYGRKMLDVGCGATKNKTYYEKRGWLAWALDKRTAFGECDKRVFRGDFEELDFGIDIDTDALKHHTGSAQTPKRTYSLLWFSNVLEQFASPIDALRKAYDLLEDTGCIFVSVPDTDFICKCGHAQFPHWKSYNYTLWTQRALVRELERIGFEVVLKRRSFSSRYTSHYNVHVIAQKKYF